jgi:hypothetical protein
MGGLKAQTRLVVLLVCACFLLAPSALAAETLVVHENFTPDRLGISTNLSVTAKFLSSDGEPPSPVIKLTLYAPAGLKIDAHGAGTCSQSALALHGPTGCPPNSRAGSVAG